MKLHGKPTREVHKDCGGAVVVCETPSLLSWRCSKCGKQVSIYETRLIKSRAS